MDDCFALSHRCRPTSRGKAVRALPSLGRAGSSDGGTRSWEDVPSERFQADLGRALAGVDGDGDPVETIARLGAGLILQQALEAEVGLFLGRARYDGPSTGPLSL